MYTNVNDSNERLIRETDAFQCRKCKQIQQQKVPTMILSTASEPSFRKPWARLGKLNARQCLAFVAKRNTFVSQVRWLIKEGIYHKNRLSDESSEVRMTTPRRLQWENR